MLTASHMCARAARHQPATNPVHVLPSRCHGLKSLHVSIPVFTACSKAHIQGEELLDFLKDAVAAVAELPPAGAEPVKGAKQKRQR